MCKLSLLAVVILSSVHTGGLAQCESLQPTGEDDDNITTEIALLGYHLGVRVCGESLKSAAYSSEVWLAAPQVLRRFYRIFLVIFTDPHCFTCLAAAACPAESPPTSTCYKRLDRPHDIYISHG